MIQYTTEQVASILALPIIIILLCWTVVIFHKNRKKWGAYDIPIISVLVLSILRNLTILAYTLAIIFTHNDFDTDYCGVVTWIFNSIHTFQASSLTSIAVIGLFSAKLHRKNQSLRTFLTSTHIIYHLFCLTTLCACVGVAAILAQKKYGIDTVFAENLSPSPCSFLPFELDIKFNVFIIVLHVFLASISLISFIIICNYYYKIKKERFDYIKKSNSDLSELSNNFHGINSNVNDNRHFYDTYTIHRNENNNFCNKDTWTKNHFNNSDVLSNNSTTVSSTNSRRPCLLKQQQQQQEAAEVEVRRTGLETMHPVLIVCYLFYHVPLIILCIYPKLIHPWPVAGIGLWLGLVQDLLIPIGLGIIDSRFCGWVSDAYSCATKRTEEKLPQVGLDGKFRPFGLSSPPQSLDISQQDRTKTLHQVEHRFPITNGSLYTSIDGRLPVIHNYRRHKEFRTGTLNKQQDLQSSNVALHSSHLNRRDIESTTPQKYSNCSNCEADQCLSHSDLHHLTPQHVHRKLSFLSNSQTTVFNSGRKLHGTNGSKEIEILPNHQNCLFVGNKRLQNTQNSLQRNQIRIETNRRNHIAQKRLSQSQESINHLFYEGKPDIKMADLIYHRSDINISSPGYNIDVNINQQMIKNSRNLLRLNKMRLSRSEDSLTDIQMESSIIPTTTRQPPSRQPSIVHQPYQENQFSSEDEEYFFNQNQHLPKDYDSMSSNNSITTDANCDFEFFQANNSTINEAGISNCQKVKIHDSQDKSKQYSNTKITRSNSKRSLENFQAFVEENTFIDAELNIRHKDQNISRVVILHRSNSFTTLENKKKKCRAKQVVSRTSSKASDSAQFFSFQNELNIRNKKIKSVEYLPNSIKESTTYIEDYKNNNKDFKFGSSVPDFKRVFISDYI
ncbi:uncharacterized protein LOC126738256 [Anthonomus grandis grandis]|uniref:uncharacterized protein LOC126738256 n=1 Tax=Anthonomus grandis grandis TaxID=2921223 RepID=UPI0021658A95|nr:uncharacterized protein LOC126738256 [Anthonomus grandis grandis]